MSSNGRTRRRSTTKKNRIYINLTQCKYDTVMNAALDRGWKICDDDDKVAWNVYWTDKSVQPERVMRLKTYQKINHFPGMHRICNKGHLAIAIRRMKRFFPLEYNFSPRSWVLPHELNDLRDYISRQRQKRGSRMPTFIVKPDRGCQGKGIHLTKSAEDIDPTVRQVAQKYVKNPLLIDGYKFDLRIYALVVSIEPLRVLLYREGLVRLCTQQYKKPTEKNMEQATMHLTNYAINKHSDTFVQNNETGEEVSSSKRRLTWLLQYLEQRGEDPDCLWDGIADIVNKTVIAVQPALAHVYESCVRGAGRTTVSPFRCFEILGFDILIDSSLKPWIVEVNHSPSFTCDSALDTDVKDNLIRDTLHLLNIQPDDREKAENINAKRSRERLYGFGVSTKRPGDIKEEKPAVIFQRYVDWETENLGNYQVIFPAPHVETQEDNERLLSGAEDIYLGLVNPRPASAGAANGTASAAAALAEARILIKETGAPGNPSSDHVPRALRSMTGPINVADPGAMPPLTAQSILLQPPPSGNRAFPRISTPREAAESPASAEGSPNSGRENGGAQGEAAGPEHNSDGSDGDKDNRGGSRPQSRSQPNPRNGLKTRLVNSAHPSPFSSPVMGGSTRWRIRRESNANHSPSPPLGTVRNSGSFTGGATAKPAHAARRRPPSSPLMTQPRRPTSRSPSRSRSSGGVGSRSSPSPAQIRRGIYQPLDARANEPQLKHWNDPGNRGAGRPGRAPEQQTARF
mmetsp:Transcript_4055/g.11845  ORF Transcript_4055/g.11845 Transcript_4055/m.11845 type:complete len:743 (-) Transcript_4055:766-2994(-)